MIPYEKITKIIAKFTENKVTLRYASLQKFQKRVNMQQNPNHILKQIPKTDKLLNLLKTHLQNANPKLLKRLTLEFLEHYRERLLSGGEILSIESCVESVAKSYHEATQKSLKPLVNATGIVVHTNLGRSVFSKEILQEIAPILTHYNNLEYDIQKGSRSERYIHLHGLFRALLGAEDVLVVNNNAAAVFLIFNTFAKGREVVVSRGELIEIGGSFRIPRVMEDSGAILKEVGTTNKTHLSDYQSAISENTAMLFKAHKSNYAIDGFTKEVEFGEIVNLAKESGILDYFDLGSGYFEDLSQVFGGFEPSLEEIARLNPSLVSFSGDKLLGGAQAGIIFGKKKYIDALKRNQLLRMLRVDKFTIATLEATLNAYLQGDLTKIPTAFILQKSMESLQKDAQELAAKIPHCFVPKVIETKSYSGGGAMPNHYLKSFGVAINTKSLESLDEAEVERFLRANGIIARLESGACVLDVRTLLEGDIATIAQAFTLLAKDMNAI